MKIEYTLTICLSASTVLGSPVASAIEGQYTPAQCDTVASNALSNPARRDTLIMVRSCPGKFGPVMATILGQTGLVTTDFETYRLVVSMAAQFSESEVFSEALGIAADGSEPELARVGALLIVGSMVYPGGIVPELERFQNYPAGGAVSGCMPSFADVGGIFTGESPIGSTARGVVDSLAGVLVASSAPRSVRFVASCLRALLHPYTGYGLGLPPKPPFNPLADFSYVRLCGRRFLLRNASYHSVALYLYWSSGARGWTMPPRAAPAAYSESSWTVPDTSSVAGVNLITAPYTNLMNETPDNSSC